jgi:hypothetical protein
MIERPPSDAPRGLCPVRGGCSARGCAAMRAVAVLRTAMRSAALDRTVGRVRGGLSGVRWLQCARLRCDARGCSAAHRDALAALDRTVGRVRGGLSGVRWLQCARLRCDARGCSGLPCALRWTEPSDAPARVVSNPSWLQCARLRCDARGCAAMRAAAHRDARGAAPRGAAAALGQRNRPGSDATEHQGAFYFLDRLGDLDAAGAGVGAVEGGTTAPDPLRI